MNRVSISLIPEYKWVICVLITSYLCHVESNETQYFSPPLDFHSYSPFLLRLIVETQMEMRHDFYRNACPDAEDIIRRKNGQCLLLSPGWLHCSSLYRAPWKLQPGFFAAFFFLLYILTFLLLTSQLTLQYLFACIGILGLWWIGIS